MPFEFRKMRVAIMNNLSELAVVPRRFSIAFLPMEHAA
jgi:hypothetical protein